MSAIMSLTKQSIRSLRRPCADCGNEGPFYEATDQDGLTHWVVQTDLTRNLKQGDDVPLAYLHACAGGSQEPESQEPESQEPESQEPTPQSPTPADDPRLKALLEILNGPQIDREQVAEIAREVATEVCADVVMPEKTVVVREQVRREIEGVTHGKFDSILKAISARRNVQLVGGPGVGKTHVVSQVADALNRPFYAIGFHLQSTASELKGYMSATGDYVWTTVYTWAKDANGGVLLTDELDRSHPGIQAALNSLLSNRWIAFPNGEMVHLSDLHIIVACTNTYGDGPTWEFPAAQKFSAEFKDRFITITMDIDADIEMAAAMAEGAPADVTKRAVSYVQRVRANVQREAITGVVVSPRASQALAALLSVGVDWDEAVASTLRKGMDADMWAKVS